MKYRIKSAIAGMAIPSKKQSTMLNIKTLSILKMNKTLKKRNPLATELWSAKYRPRKERSRVRMVSKPKHKKSFLLEL
jgi:hypothetical protein